MVAFAVSRSLRRGALLRGVRFSLTFTFAIAAVGALASAALAGSITRASITKSQRAKDVPSATVDRATPPAKTAGGPTTVLVTPTTLNGWEISNFDANTNTATGDVATTSGSDGNFVTGPGTPPSGAGSFNQIIGTNGDDGQRMRTSIYNGTDLADLVSLNYWTYVTDNLDTQATYIQLFIDTTGDGAFDDILFFEPAYQTGTFTGDPVPNQGTVTLNTWQQWDAMVGGWWSLNANTFGPPLVTLATYITANPGAQLATNTVAFRMTAGFGSGAWPNFDGNLDAVHIEDNVSNTLYDFEVVVPVELSEFTID